MVLLDTSSLTYSFLEHLCYGTHRCFFCGGAYHTAFLRANVVARLDPRTPTPSPPYPSLHVLQDCTSASTGAP